MLRKKLKNEKGSCDDLRSIADFEAFRGDFPNGLRDAAPKTRSLDEGQRCPPSSRTDPAQPANFGLADLFPAIGTKIRSAALLRTRANLVSEKGT